MICSNPNDFSPGSCPRINAAIVIDAFAVCRSWAQMAIAVCKVP